MILLHLGRPMGSLKKVKKKPIKKITKEQALKHLDDIWIQIYANSKQELDKAICDAFIFGEGKIAHDGNGKLTYVPHRFSPKEK